MTRVGGRDGPGRLAGHHTGRVPINDLATGGYLGQHGGLYPGGSNMRPTAHDSAGRSIATNQVPPRNAAGAVDLVNGRAAGRRADRWRPEA